MLRRISSWLDIHEKEVSLFLWTLAVLFLVRTSGILLNNYAETTFLKRYGVQFMPIVNMINAVITVVIMGLMTGLMQRFRGPDLLIGTFLFSGASVMGLRMLIPLNIDLIYPALFMLKALYEILLAMLFWNMANDLFNTRQSKRLFPLITAGGVVGQILGSFGTPILVEWFRFDNLLVVYLVISIAGAGVVWAMMRHFPALLKTEADARAIRKTSMRAEIAAVAPVMRKSLLLRIMVILALMPNVVIPILNYQFNYAVDMTYASESGLITFFGYFRGVSNIVNLVLLLFVGRIYGRWGLPVALMFHPLNYALAFLAFLFRFDVVSAVYARMSTTILRTTINIPANAVIIGLFPESFRAMVRPFLRGTVVRLGLFLGSSIILVHHLYFHPRYLSLVALPFVLIWLAAPFVLKKKYTAILSDLIRENQLDLKSMEEDDIGQLFRDRGIQSELTTSLRQASGKDTLWYALLLHRIKVPELDSLMLEKIAELPGEHQIELLGLLSPAAGARVSPVLSELAARDDPRLTLAVLKTVYRLGVGPTAGFDREPYLGHPDETVRAYAAAALYAQAPQTAARIIAKWLHSEDVCTQKAGIMAAGFCGDKSFVPDLKPYLEEVRDAVLLPATITALHALGVHQTGEKMAVLLQHSDQQIRRAALNALHITDGAGLKRVIPLLADADPDIRRAAAQRIETAPFVDGKTLIKALDTPSSDARELLFGLLDRLQIKDPDLFRFARDQIEGAYKALAESQGVKMAQSTPAQTLLLEYLAEQRRMLLQMVLRVLTIQDPSGRMRIISRGLMSTDSRQRANSQEAIEDLLDRPLTRILLPLLDDGSDSQVLGSGRKYFKLPDHTRDLSGLLRHLLQRDDWLTVLLTLQWISEMKAPPIDLGVIVPLKRHENAYIRQAASRLTGRRTTDAQEEKAMPEALALPKIILWLKSIEIFEQLAVNELAAVASVTEEVSFSEDQIVIREGDPGDTLYLITEGEVAVDKRQADGSQIELDRMTAGNYFGEMALFEDIPRTATIRTVKPCRMLMLHKLEFKEMVREYPQIALEICKVLSRRIRNLHDRITQPAEIE